MSDVAEYNISNGIGYTTTTDLGRHLVVSPIHHHVTKATFEYLVAKMRQKLFGWKVKTLTLAGGLEIFITSCEIVIALLCKEAFQVHGKFFAKELYDI
ncbi:hypothetical protein J1N35_038355 [Gossypium stocksii]|uniref:Uncharacterized protein n=1 Tax=Gossypium stocksii TaxID=47602 RepID=A0A9D3ULU6_9ROSI|nr:hypothetical protein J1N35_038355 [Gossypium stocksii]